MPTPSWRSIFATPVGVDVWVAMATVRGAAAGLSAVCCGNGPSTAGLERQREGDLLVRAEPHESIVSARADARRDHAASLSFQS